MSAAIAHLPFDTQTFFKRVDQSSSQQEILQLLRESEQQGASPGPEICRSFSDEAASRLSHRFT
jgi:hypothetical protein